MHRMDHEGRYRVVTQHDVHVTVRTSVEGIIEVISPEVTALLGWQPGDMVGRTPFEFVHHDDLQVAQRAHHDLNRGHTVQLIMRMRHRHGGDRWIEAVITPINDTSGRVVARLGRLSEAHAEQQVHDAMEQQEEAFRRIIDQAADMVLHTVDGIITWVSAGVERLTGWSRHEMVGTPSARWVHPDDREVMGALRSQRRPDHANMARFRMTCRSGVLRWFEVISTPLPTTQGRTAAVSVMRDITERIVAEQARELTEHRLAATLDTMFDPHSYLRPVRNDDGEVVDITFEQVNDALCRYLHCERSDIEGRRASQLFPRHMKHGIVARVREVVDTGVSFVAEGLRSWNDMLGEYRLYDITVIPVDDVVSMWHRDVTDRYDHFDAQARMRSLEALQSERERVARDLHDGAIQKVFATSLQLAALAVQLPDPHRQRLEQLIDLQDAVIRDLRATVYQLGTTGRTTSPDRSIRNTVAEATRALGFEPRLDVDDAVSALDQTTLGHVLLVLREALSNVARHAQALVVEVSVTRIGSDVLLDVWDDGVGVPGDVRRGEGLSNMERRAQMLGGACRLVSPPGEGTELIWRVPITTG